MRWDIFCKVIDNHGDAGVCWRLARDLAAHGDTVRLWIDDASPLAWMAPGGAPGVEVRAWPAPDEPAAEPGDAVVEAFGCELPERFVAAIAAAAKRPAGPPAWINLEYLTAETYAQRSHCLPSPVMSGPAAGLTKHFFYPGFTPGTGGLIREDGLLQAQAAFDRDAWLADRGIEAGAAQLVSLFCYEPAGLPAFIERLAAGPQPTHLLVAAGRATAAVQAAISSQIGPQAAPTLRGLLSISYLPLLPQPEFDRLLWACDLNFVRGEDSLVRALWAGRPFVWNIYPQHDDAHHAKLDAFLDWLGAPESLRRFHRAWNGVGGLPLPPLDTVAWAQTAAAARARALQLENLTARLRAFVIEKG